MGEDRRIVRRFTIAYVMALALIAGLSATVHVILDGIIARQQDAAVVINIAGRQRMLSQRAALFATEYVLLGREDARADLLASVDLMEKSHAALKQPDGSMDVVTPLSPTMWSLYFKGPNSLDERVAAFTAAGRSLTDPALPDAERQKALELMLGMAHRTLLVDLDRTVKLYEAEAGERIAGLQSAQRAVFIILIVTLLLEALFIFRPLIAKIGDFARRLVEAATRDGLSGLLNRRAFSEAMNRELALARRGARPLSILVADLDRFKKVNDTYGHAVGDDVIRGFAEVLRDALRGSDVAGRLGGEEFAVALPDTDLEGARMVAERLRLSLAARRFGPGRIPITVSIGVAQAQRLEDETLERLDPLLARADAALYAAKRDGRDRVVVDRDVDKLPTLDLGSGHPA